MFGLRVNKLLDVDYDEMLNDLSYDDLDENESLEYSLSSDEDEDELNEYYSVWIFFYYSLFQNYKCSKKGKFRDLKTSKHIL